MLPITCNHMPEGQGLCPECQADFEEDPYAFIEFGAHPEGDRRFAAYQAEMDAWYAANPQYNEPIDDEEIPF